MQPEQIILIPPTHEQSTPSFHVDASLSQQFIAFLKDKGITAWQPPEVLEKHAPESHHVVEITIEADTPVGFLESLIPEFFESEHVSHTA
jgi:hypothetical protein